MKHAWIVLLILPASALAAAPPPAPVEEYPIHDDGGLIYDPLRREAERTGQLARYANVAASTHTMTLGALRLTVSLPDEAHAYDVVPIPYSLEWSPNATWPTAVQATAFEDESRRQGRDLYDLALPGTLDLRVEFLGSVTAHMRPERRHLMQPDFSDTPARYPAFERRPFTRSGVVEAGDLVWFKFRYTNTGDTILDPEGIGGCLMVHELYQKNATGEYVLVGRPYNLYYRDLGYLYPGESSEVWVQFQCHGNGTPEFFGLTPGDYRLDFRMVYRWYKEFDTWVNIWEGHPMYVWQWPFTVESQARTVPPAEGVVALRNGGEADKMTRWLHTFEEFMTSFDVYQSAPKEGLALSGTLYLQVAPWTRQVVIKLITAEPVAIATLALPLRVRDDALIVHFQSEHPMTIVRNGRREPVIYSQSMADMRANVQLGPYPEIHIRERLREMLDCGINVVAMTSMPWLYDVTVGGISNHNGDAWKYVLDCARDEGMLVEGWGAYPFDRSTIREIATWITGTTVELDLHLLSGYWAVSHSDPRLPAANAAAWLHQFRRWGDLYYRDARGNMPISIEDTRGWMRQDINIRYALGERSLGRFRDWARDKYGAIEAANAAWGSSFKNFEEVNPEEGQPVGPFGHKWEYFDRTRPFHDWNAAIADFDLFRTELRMANYRDTLRIVRETIPEAAMLVRTEGGNVLVAGLDPADPNPHIRHIYYSQRRCGLIAEVMLDGDLVKWHSDYTTMPYTPSELRRLTSLAVRQGIIPAYLPQFDNMRDIAINERYGTDYQVHYNLPEPKKGMMMHSLVALYPWFVAVYESGGAPGILWEDYQCDGFATETQKRELRLFRARLQDAMQSATAAASGDVMGPTPVPHAEVRAVRAYR